MKINSKIYKTVNRAVRWFLPFYLFTFLPFNASAQLNPDVDTDTTKWFNRTQNIREVTVKAKRRRYSRRDNPAVELMRRVVEAKRQTDLTQNDYYQYNKYQKITLSLNDIQPEQLSQGPFRRHPWLVEQVETSPTTGKLIMPLSVDETVSQKVFRRQPRAEKTIIQGQTSRGVNDIFQTGDILNTVMKDVFTDVDLYQDHIRLLQYPFISPLSKEGIGFYRYYIEDTLTVERDTCIHLHFLPNNQQDMGFRGDLYLLKDSSLHVRRCEMTIPRQSNVNFVRDVTLVQDYEQLADGQWVLTRDDMTTDLELLSCLRSVTVSRTTRLSGYDFTPISDRQFRGLAREVTEPDAQMRDDAFWARYRQVELSPGESSMDKFIHRIESIPGFKYVIFGLKALFENSVETSTPNYVDLCPVNTLLTHNYVDGWRSRLSAKTTANLSPHFFLSGYYGHGWGSHRDYYSAELTYINSKQRRRAINLDAPVISLSHTVGVKGVLGGDYNYNLTEAHLYKRFWTGSWGKVDCHLKGGIQWNRVPFPLLIHPAANPSYIIEPETFNLINTLEFLNDRYASLMVSWDMNSRLLNRLPLVKRLHWREYLAVRTLWGTLTDKNNPLLAENAGDTRLMHLPEGTHVMAPNRPYTEMVLGVHNIFKFFHVEYVRRLSYNDLPTSPHWGMRYVIELSF